MKSLKPVAADTFNRRIPIKNYALLPVLLILLLLLNSFLLRPLQAAEPSVQLSGGDLVAALQKGGYNLYFRHEATDWFQTDNIKREGDWLSCDSSRVRQLSDTGRKNATATGDAIRSLGIPVTKVYASPYCRTVQTAKLMNLGQVESTTDVMNLRVSEYFGGTLAIVANARSLFAKLPAPGTNTVIVSHGNLARKAIEQSPAEGEALVLRPDGKGSFHFIGRLTSADWLQFSRPNTGKLK